MGHCRAIPGQLLEPAEGRHSAGAINNVLVDWVEVSKIE